MAAAAPEPAVTAETVTSESSLSRPQSALTRADVEEVVGTLLDARLAPIRRALLEQDQRGPGLQEIIGGIGWIFGLVGIAAYFKSRPRV